MYTITSEKREILLDWLFLVNVIEFEQSLQIYFLSVQIFDAYIEKIHFEVSKLSDIQCIGCACLCIATKLLDPEDEFFKFKYYVYLAGDSFSLKEISRMEVTICESLEYKFWNLSMPYDRVCAEMHARSCTDPWNSENPEDFEMWRHAVYYLFLATLLKISFPSEELLVQSVLYLSGKIPVAIPGNIMRDAVSKGKRFESTQRIFQDRSKDYIFRLV